MKRPVAENVPVPTAEELEDTHKRYQMDEARDVFYRAASKLLDLALAERHAVLPKRGDLTLAETMAVLLGSWNAPYYRFQKEFNAGHVDEIERLLERHLDALLSLRDRSILTLKEEDGPGVQGLFEDFESILGRVGAAKALHLMAPRFFPLWDASIAQDGYGCALGKAGTNADTYWRFMCVVKWQCEHMVLPDASSNPLKWLDEFNYRKWTLPKRRAKRLHCPGVR